MYIVQYVHNYSFSVLGRPQAPGLNRNATGLKSSSKVRLYGTVQCTVYTTFGPQEGGEGRRRDEGYRMREKRGGRIQDEGKERRKGTG
jgi:hypothetical protein